MENIPKLGHFIWIGGRLPLKNQECVKSFVTMNADWHFNLWFDPDNLLVHERRNRVKQKVQQKVQQNVQTAWDEHKVKQHTHKVEQQQWDKVVNAVGKEGGDLQTKKYLGNKYGVSSDELDKIEKSNYKQLSDFCRANRMGLCSVWDFEGGRSFSLYRQEIVARNTNFGAASDILRIDILLKLGGVYFDTDIVCMEPLGDIAAPRNGALWSASNPSISSPTTSVTKEEWMSDNWWKQFTGIVSICNSTIACHPHSEALQKYRNLIEQNYSGKMTKTAREQYYQAIRVDTLRRTGPTVASDSSGITQKKEEVKSHTYDLLTQGRNDESKDFLHQELLNLRDTLYFPMYKLKDLFFHQWL